MKKYVILLLTTYMLSSCSGISGKYSKFSEGWLGMDNSLSTYEFSSFGSVKYMMSRSGSRSSNSFNSFEGKYKIEGNNVIVNFGGSDRVLEMSDDKKTLTDSEGNRYKKQ
jgi:hypothetical protein